MLVISNNPQVWDHCVNNCSQIYGSPLEVLYRVMDMVLQGRQLYGHPIAGNERLLRNPFRTVVMTEKIEEAGVPLQTQIDYLNRALTKMEDIDYEAIPEGTKADYSTVDYELYLGTIRNIQEREC